MANGGKRSSPTRVHRPRGSVGGAIPNYASRDGISITGRELTTIVEPFPYKLHWFLSKGYQPHYFQLLFHTMRTGDSVTRFRHLVAGRRGGKTLSAAWEVLYYALHNRDYHRDFHSKDSDEPLWIWCLAKDYKLGRPALLTFKKVLREAGLTNGVEYRENKTEKYFEFSNGTLVEFKSADDPESLRGAGLDLMWIDEAAIIPNEDAWNVVSPSLADKQGGTIFTTTPQGRNWYYKEFWVDGKERSDIGRVEYRSIDNPYFHRDEWMHYRRVYHPLLFKQEFEASFDALAGVELSGEWLHYYTYRELIKEFANDRGQLGLKLYIGVDPAISLSEKADKFAMALIGITEDNINAYLLNLYVGRIPFPEQVELIAKWWHQYRPISIGIESQAFQAALAQQMLRLPGMPPIIQIPAYLKKSSRILGMAPIFKIGKVKIRKEQYDFIDEWINYDSRKSNPDDDALDAVEIALRTAGALLPLPFESPIKRKTGSLEEALERDRRLETVPRTHVAWDDEVGEW